MKNDVGKIVTDFEFELARAIGKFKSKHEIQESDCVLALVFGDSYVDKLKDIKEDIKDEDREAYIFVKDIVSDKMAKEVHHGIIDLISKKKYPIEESSWQKLGEYCWRFGYTYNYIS